MLHSDSTILFTHRGMTVKLSPAHWSYVYLIHFHQPIGNPEKSRGLAGHYLGSTGALDHRLARHKHGNGAALMAAVSKAGISWQLCRLWRFETCEEARAFERKLKRTGHNPRQCPICQHEPFDVLTYARQGHRRLAPMQGKRRPMAGPAPRFVRRSLEVSR